MSLITKDQKFSKKFHFSKFKFYGTLTSCQVSEKLNEVFSRNARRGWTYGQDRIYRTPVGSAGGSKNGIVTKRLTAVTNNVNLSYIVKFITERLSKIIFHRKHLKHHRTASKTFKESFEAVCFLDIDFSENLFIPVKFEPQSMHWSHEQVTIHSGIVKTSSMKSYRPYISNYGKHDQYFVQHCIDNMLKQTVIPEGSYIVIERDNCSRQYKSVAHFFGIQQFSNYGME